MLRLLLALRGSGGASAPGSAAAGAPRGAALPGGAAWFVEGVLGRGPRCAPLDFWALVDAAAAAPPPAPADASHWQLRVDSGAEGGCFGFGLGAAPPAAAPCPGGGSALFAALRAPRPVAAAPLLSLPPLGALSLDPLEAALTRAPRAAQRAAASRSPTEAPQPPPPPPPPAAAEPVAGPRRPRLVLVPPPLRDDFAGEYDRCFGRGVGRELPALAPHAAAASLLLAARGVPCTVAALDAAACALVPTGTAVVAAGAGGGAVSARALATAAAAACAAGTATLRLDRVAAVLASPGAPAGQVGAAFGICLRDLVLAIRAGTAAAGAEGGSLLAAVAHVAALQVCAAHGDMHFPYAGA